MLISSLYTLSNTLERLFLAYLTVSLACTHAHPHIHTHARTMSSHLSAPSCVCKSLHIASQELLR